MAHMTPEKKPIRCERDTIHRYRFFEAYDRKLPSTSFNSLCKRQGIEIPPSTGRLWLQQREIQGKKAIRRTRRQSQKLGRKRAVCEADMETVLDEDNPIHLHSYKQQVEDLSLNCQPQTLQQNLAKRMDSRRYKQAYSSFISDENKRKRVQYGTEHQDKTIRSWWRFVYFTDEVHFNSKELSSHPHYELRQQGGSTSRRINEAPAPSLDVTVHFAAGISYDYKGPLIFYHDPPEPHGRLYGSRRPRRSSVQTKEEYKEVLEAWHKMMKLQGLIEPRGNSMTMDEYANEVLPHHIQHIHKLEAKYKQPIYFQEDGDPSHGHRTPSNAPTQLKVDSHLTLLTHPPQSPDLNPIEAIWQIIKQRLRGGQWQTVAEFKAAIEREWRHVTISQIRRRISEMPRRCKAMVNTKGQRYKSKLW